MKRLCVLLMLALVGCAELQPAADQVDGVVKELVNTVNAPATEQKSRLALAQQRFAAAPTPLNRLRLAALLAALPAPLRDDARAMELLEPISEDSSAIGRFAALLATQVAERQRLAREAERLAKERASSERERQSADKERDKREEALRQQLDALRAIERGILDREERMRKKPGARP
jgi:hypothetical protein